jgi:dTDP-4-dehydrorhamnose 3,5-epimerase-like enzyme
MASRKLFVTRDVPVECGRFLTEIDGLWFEPNYRSVRDVGGLSERTVFSNPGTIVGHFVTHAADFTYDTFGVHVGQIDRLTFYSYPERRVIGYFIDCREGSPSCGTRLSLAFVTSTNRKLVIPSGVAHTFACLGGVVTRNDLSLFADATNMNWNVLNDDLVFPWTEEGIKTAPRVQVNGLEIPLIASTMFYRVQQQVLRDGHSNHNTDPLPQFKGGIPDCTFAFNSFNSIANGSWMIIANTPSCVMDFVIYRFRSEAGPFSVHRNQTLLHTFLDREDSFVTVDVVDLRAKSRTFRERASCSFRCDPRVYLRIPAGVAYKYFGRGDYAVRIERELLTETGESTISSVGANTDCTSISDDEARFFDGVEPPSVPLSPATQQSMACRDFEKFRELERQQVS